MKLFKGYVFYLSLSGVVVNEENPSVCVDPLLPALGQGPQVVLVTAVGHVVDARQRGGASRPRVNPCRPLVPVVDEEHPTVGGDLETPPARQT